MKDTIIFWESLLKVENRPDYINRFITEPTKISNTQKKLTKKAILWLLSKGPHTVEEISDHFDISAELVNYLMKDLTEANLVIKESQEMQECGCIPRYQLNLKQKKLDIKIKFPSII